MPWLVGAAATSNANGTQGENANGKSWTHAIRRRSSNMPMIDAGDRFDSGQSIRLNHLWRHDARCCRQDGTRLLGESGRARRGSKLTAIRHKVLMRAKRLRLIARATFTSRPARRLLSLTSRSHSNADMHQDRAIERALRLARSCTPCVRSAP